MAVPQFLPALSIVAATDLIATLPTRLAQRQADRYHLAVIAVPVAVRSFVVSAMTHARNAKSAMHLWVLAALSEIVDKG